MARIEKTVFISYRRTDVYTALAVYENLKNQDYDVFFDYRSISSGDFEQIISSNIKARAHFLLILTPTALDRCNEPGDWLRREIEFAIDEKRNIIPLFFKGFRFGDTSVSEKLTGKLKNLGRYNGLNVHEDYFDEAMQRLRTQYLNIPLDTVLHPISTEVQRVVREVQVAADKALEQIPDVKELAKQDQVKPNKPKAGPTPKRGIPPPAAADVSSSPEAVNQKLEVSVPIVSDKPKRTIPKENPDVVVRAAPIEKPHSKPSIDFRLIGGIAGGVVVLGLLIWGTSSLFSNLSAAPEPTQTLPINVTPLTQPPATTISQSEPTNTPVQTETMIPPSPTLGIGSTMTGKDSMTLIYVPAGEFLMGFDADTAWRICQALRGDCVRSWFEDEEPPHSVNLNSFWMDQTEVTNNMYLSCVDAGKCETPMKSSSYSHISYFGNPEFGNYPVVNVNWIMAAAYCQWVGRRLPTEAEWEKAARGPNGNVYPWGNNFDGNLVNFCDTDCPHGLANKSFKDGYADVSPVGQYPSGESLYGVLDMAGNVSEWTGSSYRSYPYDPTDGRDNPTMDDSRVARGGSWLDPGNYVRAESRGNGQSVSWYSAELGFRCAMSATP